MEDDEEDELDQEKGGKRHDHRQEQNGKGSGMIRIRSRIKKGSKHRTNWRGITRMNRGRSKSRKISKTIAQSEHTTIG